MEHLSKFDLKRTVNEPEKCIMKNAQTRKMMAPSAQKARTWRLAVQN